MLAIFHDRLRSGAWLTAERVRGYGLLMLAAGVTGLVGFLLLTHGENAAEGQPIGADFSNVWAAGRLVLEGHAPLVYDWPSHHAREIAEFGKDTPYYGWHYPPMFLCLAALL